LKAIGIGGATARLAGDCRSDAIILTFGRRSGREDSCEELFQPDAVYEVIARIDKLPPTTQPQWGKMNVAQ
jgi:hypothetical protein